MNHKKTSFSALVGWAIANKRAEFGYEQKHVADLLGVSPPTYSRLESGASSVTVDQLYRVARIFDTSASHFLEDAERYAQILEESGKVDLVSKREQASDGQGASGAGKLLVGAALGALLFNMLNSK